MEDHGSVAKTGRLPSPLSSARSVGLHRPRGGGVRRRCDSPRWPRRTARATLAQPLRQGFLAPWFALLRGQHLQQLPRLVASEVVLDAGLSLPPGHAA
ncbi:MAG: hypothetical protein ACXWDL_11400 [Nocardioides sp.]